MSFNDNDNKSSISRGFSHHPNSGVDNKAFEDHNVRNGSPINHEDIEMQKRSSFDKPPSYHTKDSTSSLSSNEDDSESLYETENSLVTTNHDLAKIQEMYVKSKLNNSIQMSSHTPISMNESKSKNEDFHSIIFKENTAEMPIKGDGVKNEKKYIIKINCMIKDFNFNS